MILTINPNPALDHVLYVDSLSGRGTIPASRSGTCIGGKGADAAFALTQLGADCRLICLMAGNYGRVLEQLYEEVSLKTALVWVEGETRVVVNILEEETHALTQISEPGFVIGEEDATTFLNVIKGIVLENDWVIGAGSLPEGMPVDFYGQVAQICHRHGAKLLLDIHGEPMRKAIPSNPDLIKMNAKEFVDTFGLEDDDLESIVFIARQLLEEYQIQAIIITLGADGILWIGKDEILQAKNPWVEVVNPAGAGDAASAAIVHHLDQGGSLVEVLKWACAAGASVAVTERTAEIDQKVLFDMLPQVAVFSLSAAGKVIAKLSA